jgi:hypothetical protein
MPPEIEILFHSSQLAPVRLVRKAGGNVRGNYEPATVRIQEVEPESYIKNPNPDTWRWRIIPDGILHTASRDNRFNAAMMGQFIPRVIQAESTYQERNAGQLERAKNEKEENEKRKANEASKRVTQIAEIKEFVSLGYSLESRGHSRVSRYVQLARRLVKLTVCPGCENHIQPEHFRHKYCSHMDCYVNICEDCKTCKAHTPQPASQSATNG